jgi:hypothetical protein
MKKTLRLSILAAVIFGVACSPKNSPRQVHEGKREWVPTQTPDDPSVDADSFGSFNMAKAYQDLKDNNPQALMKNILLPMSGFVLNQRIVEAPRYRTSKLTQMIHVFHQALLAGLDRKDTSADFAAIKEKYYQTVFAGCSSDLRRDCINVGLFSNDARFMRIMTRYAQDMDAQIENELKANGTPAQCVEKSPSCRSAIEERYRRLAMANMNRNRNDDSEFSFAYLKYARVFAALLDYDKKTGTRDPGYIAEVHGKIFETIIARYNPKSLTNGEFKTFVENFNPWVYSQKRADTFQYGTKIMFKFGAECCLYQDPQKSRISEAVKSAIAESQKDSDSFGLSFLQMVQDIEKDFGDQLFVNLGMGAEVGQLKNVNSSFYNEYFLVVDRLFRGHLNSSEVEMVLRNTPAARTQEQLPKVISTYVKIYLIHLVVETNRFMNSIYTSNIASDKVFEEATSRSRELTSRWHTVQSQIDLLERVMGSYFKGQNLFSAPFVDTTRLIKSVNRNIHYISVYPNMIVMNYFLAKMKGKIVVNTWWGRIEINADTILDAFFDGMVTNPWFRFGKDAETLDRQMLLYGWDYMLSTGSLKGIDREKFYELIFTKYVDDNLYDLRKQINDFERNTFGNFNYGNVDALCDYELDNKRFPPSIKINVLELNRYTYSGLGDNGTNSLLNKLLGEPASAISSYRNEVDTRLVYIRSMIDLVERDLMRRGQITAPGQAHPETAKGYAMLKEFQDLKLRIAKLFVPQHKRLFECALRLQEIERRRANRLYEEERAHLGRIFDEMRPLVAIKDKAALDQKVAEINQRLFKAQNSEYRFDSIHGLTYRMSRYDLLMRTKKRVESDIFTNLTETEKSMYGESNSWYARPRNVTVYIPEGLSRDDMVTQETANTIYVNGDTDADREAFIRDGMAAFNGKAGSFIEWQGQRSNDKGLTKYLDSLTEFYLLGPVTDEAGNKYEVTADDLAQAFVKVYASYALDPVDVKNSVEFKNDGRFDRNFFNNLFFEANGARLPFFYDLMVKAKGRAGTNIEGRSEGSTAAADAYAFAQTMINLRTFVFPPSPAIEQIVKKNYGDRANDAFRRVNDLFDHLAKIEKDAGDVAKLDPRLRLPFYLQEGRPVVWYSSNAPMVDTLKRNDHKIQIEDFARRTDNFFKTRENVKVQ